MFDHNFQVTLIRTSESKLVSDFVNSAPYYFRHLDWHLPSDWIGSSPFLVCSYQAQPIAILICPFQEDGAIWLRCFSARAFHSMKPAWHLLMAAAKKELKDKGARTVHSICLVDWYRNLLDAETFQQVNEVVVFEKLLTTQEPDPVVIQPGYTIRAMSEADIPSVWLLDRDCFEPLWQMNQKDLYTAFRISQNCSLIENSLGEVIGYQISNYLPTGGHLARIAVHPGHQGKGLSKSLLNDLISRFKKTGIERITVNTQGDNLISTNLYRQFGFTQIEEKYPVFQLEL